MSNSDGKSFSAEDLDRFFNESFEKEGLRIKRSSAVFDFMADRNKKCDRSCVILDVPSSVAKGNAISVFSENIRTLLTSSFPVDGIDGYTG